MYHAIHCLHLNFNLKFLPSRRLWFSHALLLCSLNVEKTRDFYQINVTECTCYTNADYINKVTRCNYFRGCTPFAVTVMIHGCFYNSNCNWATART